MICTPLKDLWEIFRFGRNKFCWSRLNTIQWCILQIKTLLSTKYLWLLCQWWSSRGSSYKDTDSEQDTDTKQNEISAFDSYKFISYWYKYPSITFDIKHQDTVERLYNNWDTAFKHVRLQDGGGSFRENW